MKIKLGEAKIIVLRRQFCKRPTTAKCVSLTVWGAEASLRENYNNILFMKIKLGEAKIIVLRRQFCKRPTTAKCVSLTVWGAEAWSKEQLFRFFFLLFINLNIHLIPQDYCLHLLYLNRTFPEFYPNLFQFS